MRGTFLTEHLPIQLGKEDSRDAGKYDRDASKKEYLSEQSGFIRINEKQSREKGDRRPDRKNPHTPQKSPKCHVKYPQITRPVYTFSEKRATKKTGVEPLFGGFMKAKYQ